MGSLHLLNTTTLELLVKANRAAEKAQQAASSPDRWTEVVKHLSDVRLYVHEIRRRTEAESTSST
jgi:hypothetical protein